MLERCPCPGPKARRWGSEHRRPLPDLGATTQAFARWAAYFSAGVFLTGRSGYRPPWRECTYMGQQARRRAVVTSIFPTNTIPKPRLSAILSLFSGKYSSRVQIICQKYTWKCKDDAASDHFMEVGRCQTRWLSWTSTIEVEKGKRSWSGLKKPYQVRKEWDQEPSSPTDSMDAS